MRGRIAWDWTPLPTGQLLQVYFTLVIHRVNDLCRTMNEDSVSRISDCPSNTSERSGRTATEAGNEKQVECSLKRGRELDRMQAKKGSCVQGL